MEIAFFSFNSANGTLKKATSAGNEEIKTGKKMKGMVEAIKHMEQFANENGFEYASSGSTGVSYFFILTKK